MKAPKGNTYKLLARSQSTWALNPPRTLARPGYVAALGDNLLLGTLNPETEAEFRSADGGELKDVGRRPAKMRALLSSSALAVNVFDYWRARTKDSISDALDLPSPVKALGFEYRCCNHPIGPKVPNIDVRLMLQDGSCLAIESKFCEPYDSKTYTDLLSPKYFSHPAGFWSTRGLERAQRLAETLNPQWRYLNVPQLLKHLLGLSHETEGTPHTLLYLWFDPGTAESRLHQEEIERCSSLLDAEPVSFKSLTYQAFFERLSSRLGPSDSEYRAYLRARYFQEAA